LQEWQEDSRGAGLQKKRIGKNVVGTGIGCGLITAVIVIRLMSSLLFRVSPFDPVTYAAVACGIVAVAFLASYLPSRRAATSPAPRR